MSRSTLLVICLTASVLPGCVIRPSPDVLAETAINGTPLAEQEKAVLELGRYGRTAVPALRRVANESKSPVVRGASLHALGAFGDIASGPSMLEAMEDSDPRVRGRAAVAMANIIGADYHFRADDPPAKRKAVIEQMRKSYEQLLSNPDLKN